MYADSAGKLKEAKDHLRSYFPSPYVARVEAFISKQEEEWVLLFRSAMTTRGHNTNNFAEASIRVLKDIVLSRTKAFNAVALVSFMVDVWETYLKGRLLDHAHNRVAAHRQLYDELVKRMPEQTAEGITQKGTEPIYLVPSGKSHEVSYEVSADVGTCTCRSGSQGAFCKHQALAPQKFGGNFPNAPLLTAEDRLALGKLVLGDVCPSLDYFKGFHDVGDDYRQEATQQTASSEAGAHSQAQEAPQGMKYDEQPSTSGIRELIHEVSMYCMFNIVETGRKN